MMPSSKLTVVLDACVLYPAPVRDLLLHLANFDLYYPKWTKQIQLEWKKSLLKNRPDLKSEQLEKTISEMNKAFPNANVLDYESFIPSIKLPDLNDSHVLAAAIHSQAAVIVTSNLKDFPAKYLKGFDIEAQHPDIFIASLIDLNPDKSLRAFRQQVSFLKNPPMTESQVLSTLFKSGLTKTCAKLTELNG
jgi:predicted nucleic acid-binding protein